MSDEENLLLEGTSSPPSLNAPVAGRQARAILGPLNPVTGEPDTNATIETMHPLAQTVGVLSTEISKASKIRDEILLLIQQLQTSMTESLNALEIIQKDVRVLVEKVTALEEDLSSMARVG